MKNHYEKIIIGKGLAGTAAAKYMSIAGCKAAIIGPDEPSATNDSSVYGSHYDQARVQRIVGKDEVWTKLNYDSAIQYENIQKESGVRFHKAAGCLYVNPYGNDSYLERFPVLAEQFGVPFDFDGWKEEIHLPFSELNFPAKSAGVLEGGHSGFINPRLLITAQLEIFKKHGGHIFKEVVTHVSLADKIFVLKTEKGNTYSCNNLLVTTSSFANYFNILPKKVALATKSEVVLLIKTDSDTTEKLASLPSLLYEIDEEGTEGIYMIPPVKYPDGEHYLKIGCNSPGDIYFQDLKQIQDWFRNGDCEKFAPALMNAVHKILPLLNLETVLTKKCVISRTVTGRPYIGETSQPGMFIAGGCNGYSAMCSDAIGKVASHLILHGKFPQGYADGAFDIVYS